MKRKENKEMQQLEAVYRRMERCNICTSASAWHVVPELQAISRSLSRIGERQCSEQMGEKTEARLAKRETRLVAQATELAASIGASLYYQTDPRGAAVYLIFPGDVPDGREVDSYYSNGVAIW